MSALNILRQREAVHVLTDGASYDMEGVLRLVRPKAFAMPNLSAVIATRGPHRSLDLIGTGLVSLFTSFDELCEGIGEALPEICEHADMVDPDSGVPARIELAIAGWSAARARSESYMIATAENDWAAVVDLGSVAVQELEPFQLTEMPDFSIAPLIAEDVIREAMADAPSAPTTDAMHPDIHGLAIMELQRQQLNPMPGGDGEFYLVGGFAMVSTVTADAISHRILKSWPDEIGELISPEPIDWPTYWRGQKAAAAAALIAKLPDGLSRLQRERMEKKARKGTLRAVQ